MPEKWTNNEQKKLPWFITEQSLVFEIESISRCFGSSIALLSYKYCISV